ncbi:MAG: AMP nucleosidase, partial [Paracoccaceae bacterium]
MNDILTPNAPESESFEDAAKAVARLEELYSQSTTFLRDHFVRALSDGAPDARVRAFYPQVLFETSSYAQVDTRLSFGHVSAPGCYRTTITRPDLFRSYLTQQIGLLIENHGQPVKIGLSETPMPVHFAVAGDAAITVPQEGAASFTLRDVFDVPDLTTTNDDIVNGTFLSADGIAPLAPFTAQRVDYSLARLAHYTATDPEHFQNHVLFTNYQFYVSEFEAYAREQLRDSTSGYTSFVSTDNAEITDGDAPLASSSKTPQMPTYHLKRA